MTETGRADEQSGNNFIAYAEVKRGIEHVVRQAHGGGHGNHIAGEQREFHARLALGYAIAHGGYATGKLRGRTHGAGGRFNGFREGFKRLVGREHVVVRRNNP